MSGEALDEDRTSGLKILVWIVDRAATWGLFAIGFHAMFYMLVWPDTPPSTHMLWWTIALSFIGAGSRCSERAGKRWDTPKDAAGGSTAQRPR